MSMRLRPSKLKSLVILTFWSEPSRLETATSWPVLQGAVEDARDGEAAEVVGVVEVGDQDLQRAVGVALGGGDGLDDQLEERLEIGAGLGEVHGRGADLAVGVETGKSSMASSASRSMKRS